MRRSARMLLAATLVLVMAAPALAHGPSGSREHRGKRYTNRVRCAKGTSTPVVGVIYAGTNGAEVCNDGRGAVPVYGRAIVTTQQGGYVAIDGDRRNEAPLDGWARLDAKGPRCGDTRGRLDSTHPNRRDTSADCG